MLVGQKKATAIATRTSRARDYGEAGGVAGIGEPVIIEIAGFLQLRCISAVPKKLTPSQGIEARGNSARRANFDHMATQQNGYRTQMAWCPIGRQLMSGSWPVCAQCWSTDRGITDVWPTARPARNM